MKFIIQLQRLRLFCFVVLVFIAPARILGVMPGRVDSSFEPGAGLQSGGDGMVLQPDGKLVVAGDFASSSSEQYKGITRLNPDGSRDAGFEPDIAVSSVHDIALTPDGKILVCGFGSFGPHNRVARLNSNGTLDPEFDPGSGPNGSAATIVSLPEGKVLIGGSFTSVAGTNRNGIARLHSDGSLDLDFNPGSGVTLTNATGNGSVAQAVVQPDGKIIIGGIFHRVNGVNRRHLARLNSDGSLDQSFDAGLTGLHGVETVALQTNGAVLIGGTFTSVNGTNRNRIARLHPDGRLDLDFDPGTGADHIVNSVAVLPDGKVLVGGGFTNFNGVSHERIARLNADGSLDASFNPLVQGSQVRLLIVQPDGKYILGGFFDGVGDAARDGLARLHEDGSLDSMFDAGSGVNDWTTTVLLQPDGKLVIGGNFTTIKGMLRNRIARLNSDGSADLTFDPGTGANDLVECIALQADGKVVIGGRFTAVNGVTRNRIARLNSDGSLDLDFNPGSGANNDVRALLPLPGGQLLIAGQFSNVNGVSRNHLARLNSNGSLDLSFTQGADNVVLALARQSDGKLLIGGSFTALMGGAAKRIARLHADGSLDPGFNTTAITNGGIRVIRIQSDGKVLGGGTFNSASGQQPQRILRLATDGSLDPNFYVAEFTGGGGILDMAVQPDGKIIVVGDKFSWIDGIDRRKIGRLRPDGALDLGFDPGTGAGSGSAGINSIALQPDGKIVVATSTKVYDDQTRWHLVRLHGGDLLEILASPQSATNGIGAAATFTVSATGQPPLNYQWRKAGVALPADTNFSGITTATLTINDAQWHDEGDYDVVVSDTSGSLTSQVAVLTLVIPSIATPDSLFVLSNASRTLPVSFLTGNDVAGPANGTSTNMTLVWVSPISANGGTIAWTAGPPGRPLWTNYYNGIGDDFDGAIGVAVDDDENIILTGYSWNGVNDDYVTIAYARTGQPLWTNLLSGVGDDNDWPGAIGVGQDGNIVVAGYTSDGAATSVYTTVSYSNGGMPLWTNFFSRPDAYYNEATDLTIRPDGVVVVAGYSQGNDGDDFATVAYSNAGMPLWTNLYDGPGNKVAQAIAVDSVGTSFVTGSAQGTAAVNGIPTVAYSATGVALWTNLYGGTGDYSAGSVVTDSTGAVIVAGYAQVGDNDSDWLVLKYSNSGIPLWTNQYADVANGYNNATHLATDANGNVIIIGHAENSEGHQACVTIKYSPAGVPLWTNRLEAVAGQNAYGISVAVDGEGNVYAVAQVYAASGYSDMVTAAFANNGSLLWSNYFNGPAGGDDYPTQVIIGNQGDVYIAGNSDVHAIGNSDYSLIKYAGSGSLLAYIPAPGFVGTDTFQYAVRDSLGMMTTGTVVVTILSTNYPPTSDGFSATTIQQEALQIPVAQLLAQATDPEGDAVTLQSVAAVSTNNALITLTNQIITYTPASDFVGADQFDIVIADSLGATNVLGVQIAVLPPGTTVQSFSEPTIADGEIGFNFTGNPGELWIIQRATDPAGPWTNVANLLIQADGTSAFLDSNPPEGAGYYRAMKP